MKESEALLLVYNANNDRISKAFDVLHKMVSPKTYQCDLCKLTHGNFRMKSQWEVFSKVMSLNVFYKRDFLQAYPSSAFNNEDFPLILYKRNSKIKVLLDKEELKGIPDTNALIQKIKQKINANSY